MLSVSRVCDEQRRFYVARASNYHFVRVKSLRVQLSGSCKWAKTLPVECAGQGVS